MKILAGGMAAALLLAAGAASAEEFRIGFVTTLTGFGAIQGQEQVGGWTVGLDHEGWAKDGDRLAGIPTAVFYADDQAKTDVARREVEKLLDARKVHLVAGFIPSHVLMVSLPPILARGIPLVVTNAGPSPIAGAACDPLIVSTSSQIDTNAEALGQLMTDDRIETIHLVAPNFQGGKDVVAGLTRTLNGPKVVGQTFFKIGESDFQADISRIRADKPRAVFVFAPGAMGISFLKQWAASGAGQGIRLYTLFTIDNMTLPAIGAAAVGTYHTMQWSPDLDNATNKTFVRDYIARFKRAPSHMAAQAYDGARLIAAALKANGGRFADGTALARALRKTAYPSTRGAYSYNVNGMPIQAYYKREVVMGASGMPEIVNRGAVFTDRKDAYWEQCPPAKRF